MTNPPRIMHDTNRSREIVQAVDGASYTFGVGRGEFGLSNCCAAYLALRGQAPNTCGRLFGPITKARG